MLRVMAGSARGVPLQTVPDMNTRPILDRVKKSLFSMLDAASLLVDAKVMDLYAGTGTQGIEALSRGAEACLFVERRADAVKLLQQNLLKTKLAAQAEIICADVGAVLRALRGGQFDLILYDPPFSFVREDESRAAAEAELALAGTFLYPGHGRLVLRLEAKAKTPEPAGLTLARYWKDGGHAFAFYSVGRVS